MCVQYNCKKLLHTPQTTLGGSFTVVRQKLGGMFIRKLFFSIEYREADHFRRVYCKP